MNTSNDETLSALISENARIGAELRKVTEILTRVNGEHDAAIAAQAREKVLTEIVEHLQSKRGEVMRMATDAYPIGVLDGTMLYLKSLRTGGDPTLEKCKTLRNKLDVAIEPCEGDMERYAREHL